MKHYLLFIFFVSSILSSVLSQSADQNYIRTIVPRVESTDASALSPSQALITIGYFDGLGRPVQTVAQGITPQANDLVAIQEYDAAGRLSHEWLPVSMAGTAGSYRSPEIVKNESAPFYNGDAYAYTRTYYDSSPLKRIVKKVGPGDDWHTNDKTQKTDYLTNTATGDLAVPYFTVEGNRLKRTGFYPAGALTVTVSKDEDDVTYYDFIDNEGKRIRYKNVDYVYDDMGHLRYVLTPFFWNIYGYNIKADGFYDVTPDSGLYKACYVYTYDKRGNCIAKKLPGIEPIYYVYDKADRLILVQTPNQRSRKEWSFTKYDVFSRPILSGTTIINNKTHVQLQNEYAATVSKEYLSGGASSSLGYTNETMPKENLTILKADYYDNYAFKSAINLNTQMDFQLQTDFLSSYYALPVGQHTGSIVRTFDTSSVNNVRSVFYYDQKGLLIQQRSNNLVGGYDAYYTSYNFAGEPNEVLHTHSSSYVSSLTERYSYTYDHGGRLRETTHSLNGGAARIIALNDYDELGRLSKKTLPDNSDIITYGYNIRNWLNQIQSTYYKQTNNYGYWVRKPESYYNGNPSCISYSTTYKDPVTQQLKQTDEVHMKCSYGQDCLVSANSVEILGKNFSLTGKMKESGGSDPNGMMTRTYNKQEEDYLLLSSWNYGLDYIYEGGYNDVSSLPIQFTTKYPDTTPTFFYDANGNLYKDLNRNITNIDYNLLNLPNSITFENGSNICYRYDADGVKHRADYTTVFNEVLVPIGFPSPASSASLSIQHHTDYCDNLIYEDNVLKKIRIDGGYINYNPSTNNGEYCYYIQDHIGNNRVILSETRGVIQYADYYPYGIPFSEIPMEEDNFLHAGKELEKMHGLYWYDNGKRWYDPILCRFTTMDPLCEKFYDKNPYSYCAENPMKYGDPTGELASPYYDIDGNFLGVDENGFSGNIYITDSKTVDKYSKDNIINSKAIQADKNTTFVRSVALTVAAESHIYTDVLKKSSDPNLDMFRLYNGEISVLEKPVTRGNDTYGKGYNDPYPDRRQAKYTEIDVGEEIKVTVSVRSYVTDLYTVESIWNQLGIHEYYGHGIKGWKGDKDHWRCYQAQMKHPSYRKLPQDQKKEIYGRYNEFYKKSQGY
ncbi:DUF6443 domain-containing protein [Bacteroides salyersiae]|uniref:DUF6443 domain-containing protein n=1 Tax=Bacteroides salyersiae TaxID=291644 RepID=UPI001C8CA49B|nr:DUF6443 domain-containing protein [Bacteroides salyersiae]